MNIQSTLYYRHVDPTLMRKIDELFMLHEGKASTFKQLAKRIHSSRGHIYAEELLHFIFDLTFDLKPQKIMRYAGFSITHFEHGSDGDQILEAVLDFLKKTVPDLHVQAWGYSQEESWEYWLKFDAAQLQREDDLPHHSPFEDLDILNSVYRWWHHGMPKQITEGILNEHHLLPVKH